MIGCAVQIISRGDGRTLPEHLPWNIGMVRTTAHCADEDFGIDELLFIDLDTPRDLFPKRMARRTAAIAFLFIGAVLLLTLGAARTASIATLARILTACVFIIGALGISGYALDFEVLYNCYIHSSMYAHGLIAFHTAVGFAVMEGVPGAAGLAPALARGRSLPTPSVNLKENHHGFCRRYHRF